MTNEAQRAERLMSMLDPKSPALVKKQLFAAEKAARAARAAEEDAEAIKIANGSEPQLQADADVIPTPDDIDAYIDYILEQNRNAITTVVEFVQNDQSFAISA